MNNNIIDNMFILLYVNFHIYIIVQLMNNMSFIFNINNFNSSSYNNIQKKYCNDAFKNYDIIASVNSVITLVYFIVKCHRFNIMNTNNKLFSVILLLNISVNSYNIINYFTNYPIQDIEYKCDKFDYLESFIYSNVINISYFSYNLLIFIFNTLVFM